MDGPFILVSVSNIVGWIAFVWSCERLKKYRDAWINQCAQTQRESDKAATAFTAARIAGDEIRSLRRNNEALSAKCEDLSKQLIATREHLIEADKLQSDSTDLSLARFKQVEDLQAAALVASGIIDKLTTDKAELLKELESFRTGHLVK